MRRLMLAVALGLAGARPAPAQDDYDLAGTLAERGWYDLAAELFAGIRNSASLTPEKRAEGAYGLARLKSAEADREPNPDKKAQLFDVAIADIREFIKAYPTHPRHNEAYADIGDLYGRKGKYFMGRAKVDAAAVDKAKDAFNQAEQLFAQLITNLKGKKPERPDEDLQKKDKPQYERKMAEYVDWEQRMMFAKFNYGISLFNHAETYRDKPDKHGDMKTLLEKMVKFFEDDYMWEFEDYIKAYEAFIYMGRSCQLLAEASESARAEDFWKKCFTFIGKARSLLTDAKLRQHEGVRWVAMESCFHEMKARMAYAETRKAGAATKQLLDAAKLAEEIFKYYPTARTEDLGRGIRIELGRCYCKAGKLNEGVKVLNELKAEAQKLGEVGLENLVIDILGEYVGETNIETAVEAADNYADRGPAYLYGAIQRYRKALSSVKKKEDERHIPKCWYQIGYCYYALDRHWEAVAACTALEAPQFKGRPEAANAALLKLQCLARIKKITGRPEDDQEYTRFLKQATDAYPKEVGSGAHRNNANELDIKGDRAAEAKKYKDEYLQAAESWGRLAQDSASPYQGEAMFFLGLDCYRHAWYAKPPFGPASALPEAEWRRLMDRGLGAFRNYMDWYNRRPAKESQDKKYALGSIYYACVINNNDRIKKHEDALRMSADLDKRFPDGDPVRMMKILAQRVDAKLGLGRFEEAEDDVRAMKARYEGRQGEQAKGIGLDSYVTALGFLAQTFEEEAAKLQKKDPEKSEIFSIRSGNYYYDLYQKDPSKFKGATIDAVAGKFFMIARQKMEQAQKDGNKQTEQEAREFYEKARELYQQYRTSPGVKLTAEQEVQIQNCLTECYLQTGQGERAVSIYQEITGKDPERLNGTAWEALADCYIGQARQLTQGQQRNDLIKKADEIYADLATRRMQAQRRDQHFWRLLYRHAECMFEVELEQLSAFFKIMDARQYAPAWDDGKWGFQTKFEELRRKLREKMPEK